MKHIEDRPYGAATYQNHGCRCDVCRKANTEHVARWRANRREFERAREAARTRRERELREAR